MSSKASTEFISDEFERAGARPRGFGEGPDASHEARILAEYESLDKAGKGALLRREGIYSSLISARRLRRDQGALQVLAKPAGRLQTDRSIGLRGTACFCEATAI
jgi:transposase